MQLDALKLRLERLTTALSTMHAGAPCARYINESAKAAMTTLHRWEWCLGLWVPLRRPFDRRQCSAIDVVLPSLVSGGAGLASDALLQVPALFARLLATLPTALSVSAASREGPTLFFGTSAFVGTFTKKPLRGEVTRSRLCRRFPEPYFAVSSR